MCWACERGSLVNPHGDHRTITTSVLADAAKAASIDVPTLIARMVKNLAPAVEVVKGADEKGIAGAAVVLNVVKAEAPQRYTLGLAYPAMRPDVGRAADGHIDFAGEAVLEKAAWAWMKNRDVNLFHQGDTLGHAEVVESYIYRGPDWTQTSPVDGKAYVIKAGDWLMGTVWDEVGWGLVEAGLVKGWSPEGAARRSTPSAERLGELRS